MLYLRPDERQMFSALAEGLTGGVLVEDENVEPTDSATAMRVRLELLRVQDPLLSEFAKKAVNCATAEEASALFAATDISSVHDDDLAELFFALGSLTLTAIIKDLLAKASTAEDLEDLEALTGIRH